MIKKQFLLMLLIALCCVCADASTWKRYSYYVTSKIQNVYDTGDKVYYLNDGSLFRFDKYSLMTIALNTSNILHDNNISQIYYDWQSKLLFIAYQNCNIDIVDESGRVYIVNRLKDVVTAVHNMVPSENGYSSYTGKKINDITFADGKAYVTLDYGYVVIDEATKSIKNNVVLTKTKNINSVAVIGNMMVFLTNEDCYYGPIGSSNPLNEFSHRSGTFTGAKMYPIDETSVFMLTTTLQRYAFSGTSSSVSTLVSSAPTSVQKTPTGFIANFSGQKFYYTINPEGTTATKASSTLGFATCDPSGDGSVWINDGDGLRLKGSTTSYKLNSLTTDEPYWLKYNTAMDRLYVCSSALNALNRPFPNNMADNVINYFDGENWHNATPYSTNGSGYEFVFNPADSTTYFRASWENGIHRVTNDALKLNYTKYNSPIGKYKAHPAFDNYGNMWVVSSYIDKQDTMAVGKTPVVVLPANKVSNASVSKADWFVPSGLRPLNTGAMQRSRFVISKKNNVKIYCDGEYKRSIWCWDNFSQDIRDDNYRLVEISSFIDQNNQYVDWQYLIHMEQTSDGLVWVGTTTGLFIFDPDEVFDEVHRAVRPIITQPKEGKGRLCEGHTVYDIAEDADHNKWIATSNGVYYVSPDGFSLYDHFSIHNSDIPSNLVYSVECDTKHGRVYIFTDNGFAEYLPEGDAPALDFSNVYAFPSPVEPDFTGLVKIAGLMDDTYVTITDHNGNVVRQIGPASGRAFWDCCAANGERVATGVYNIFVAQGAYPVISGEPNTTIMIIK